MMMRTEAGKSEYARHKTVSIPRAAFARVVRHTLAAHEGTGKKDVKRISPMAILALQRFAEQSVGDSINRAVMIAEAIGNTKTLMTKHLVAASRASHVSAGAKLGVLEH
jgi:histone H3/H4